MREVLAALPGTLGPNRHGTHQSLERPSAPSHAVPVDSSVSLHAEATAYQGPPHQRGDHGDRHEPNRQGKRGAQTEPRPSADRPRDQPLKEADVVRRYGAVHRHLAGGRRPFDGPQGDEHLPKSAPFGLEREVLGKGGGESLDIEDQ